MKYVIIGGVAGGATAAARLRRLDEQAEIIIIQNEPYISYANCGLPYYIGNVVTSRSLLFRETPEQFKANSCIDVRIGQEAIAIDRQTKNISIRRSDRTEYTESYDKLLLATGAHPVIPPIGGTGTAGIFTLRHVHDMDQIKDWIQQQQIKEALVIGSGFIGLEMTDNLQRLGIAVTLLERSVQVMPALDYPVSAFLYAGLMDHSVNVMLQEEAESFENTATGIRVQLKSGKTIITGMVILSIGIAPNSALAADAGLKLGPHRGVWVNSFLQTSDPLIYAVGDMIEYPNPVTGELQPINLAGPANRQGWIAAYNLMYGNRLHYEGSVRTAVTRVFSQNIALTGLSEKAARAAALPCQSSITFSTAHARYYFDPGSLLINLVFNPDTGLIYGAQCIGTESVDKRIDLIGQFIKRQGTVEELTQLEQAYAPPFSTTKDAAAIAGYTALNILTKEIDVVSRQELSVMLQQNKNCFLLDIRSEKEFEADIISYDNHSIISIPRPVNIPLAYLRKQLNRIPKDKDIILFGHNGSGEYVAQRILRGHGFKSVVHLSGGLTVLNALQRMLHNADSQSAEADHPA